MAFEREKDPQPNTSSTVPNSGSEVAVNTATFVCFIADPSGVCVCVAQMLSLNLNQS